MEGDLRQCTENCLNCRQTCLETLEYCKQQGGDHANSEHLRLLEDCAKICETSADFMQRGSALHAKICAPCAGICEKCAESCEQFSDDEQMAKCAEMCRQCAESCKSMA